MNVMHTDFRMIMNAFERGQRAHTGGLSADENPFPISSMFYAVWSAGWTSGQEAT